jgi:hypothetical protein
MAEELEIEGSGESLPNLSDVTLSAALDEAAKDPALRPRLDELFTAQTELLRDQRHHMALQFKLEHRAKRIDVWSKRLKLVLQGVTVTAALAAAGAIGLIARRAHEDHSLVLSAFDVSSDLTAKGVSGRSTASDLMDKVLLMQRQTATSQQGAQVRADEGRQIRLEMPETGISLAEVQSVIEDLLAHRTPISGSLDTVHGGPDDGSLALSVRVGNAPGVRILQPDGDLDALLQKGAEAVEQAAEPFRFAAWLQQNGRTPETDVLYRRLSRQGPAAQRSMALERLAYNEPSPSEAQRLLKAAIDLDPLNTAAMNNLSTMLPESEEALALLRRAVQTASRQDPDWPFNRLGTQANADDILGQYADGLRSGCLRFGVKTCDSRVFTDRALATDADNAARDASAPTRLAAAAYRIVMAHDLGSAKRLLDAQPSPDMGRSEGYRAFVEAIWLNARTEFAYGAGDWNAALTLAPKVGDAVSKTRPYFGIHSTLSSTALPLAHLGRFAEADAAAAALSDCYLCLVVKGQVAAIEKRWAQADQWFAKADAMAPSFPQADTAWGESLLARGDPDGAVAKLKVAVKRTPHNADPIETWGEALMAKGDFRGGAAKFAEAAKYAPYWGRLHLKWAEALAKAGMADEARAQKQTAASLDLAAAERLELDRLRI